MFFYSQIKNVSQEKNQKGKKKGKGKSIPVSQQPEMLFDVALKDIELNLKLPVTKQYIEIGIWKNVQKINLELQRTMSKITDKSSQQVLFSFSFPIYFFFIFAIFLISKKKKKNYNNKIEKGIEKKRRRSK